MKDQGIVLSGMPNLEWAPNNLTGHGGTEIDGRWYYTYEQALAAAAELGDGWRLPTAEEFQKLTDAGSTWNKEYKGLQRDKLFLKAAGMLRASDRKMIFAGEAGNYWSSLASDTDHCHTGFSFSASSKTQLDDPNEEWGFSVRCVREIR